MDIVSSFLATTQTGNTRATPHQVEFEIEVDARDRNVRLKAWCECGHDFPPEDFTHPEQAWEAAGELACPNEPEDEPQPGDGHWIEGFDDLPDWRQDRD